MLRQQRGRNRRSLHAAQSVLWAKPSVDAATSASRSRTCVCSRSGSPRVEQARHRRRPSCCALRIRSHLPRSRLITRFIRILKLRPARHGSTDIEGKPGRYWHPWRTAASSATSARAIASCTKASAACASCARGKATRWYSPPMAAHRAFASTRSRRSRSITSCRVRRSCPSALPAAT